MPVDLGAGPEDTEWESLNPPLLFVSDGVGEGGPRAGSAAKDRDAVDDAFGGIAGRGRHRLLARLRRPDTKPDTAPAGRDRLGVGFDLDNARPPSHNPATIRGSPAAGGPGRLAQCRWPLLW